MEKDMPYEDQLKFSGLFGSDKAVTPPPLGHYRLLGKSGLRVSPLCLSTFAFGERWQAMTGEITEEQAEKVFLKYIEQGGNFIDTALNYQDGESTRWLGNWISKAKCRDDLVIAAKYSLPLNPGKINSAGNHRKCLIRAVNETLDALGTTYIICCTCMPMTL